MDNATLVVGAAAPAPKPAAKAAAQKRRAIPAFAKAQERHHRGVVRPRASRPCGAAAYGFLKTRFLPHHTGQPQAAAQEKEPFYAALDLLCSHYGIAPVDTRPLAYPYGRAVALHEVRRLLKGRFGYGIDIRWEADTDGQFALHATEYYNTRNTLYYIPVVPLHRLLQHRKRKRAAQLLLHVFAYLYHKAGVPYYGDEGSYLYWNYEMHFDWVLNDPDGWDAEYYNGYVSEIHTARFIGEVMHRRIWNPVQLERFGQAVRDFTPCDGFGRVCLALAKSTLNLWQDYPKAHLYRHADESCLPDPEEGYYDNDCVTMEKYIGFCAETSGWLYESLEQAINGEFGECTALQEPVLRRCFDGRAQETGSLDYECRLFGLLDDLCYLLNNPDDGNN